MSVSPVDCLLGDSHPGFFLNFLLCLNPFRLFQLSLSHFLCLIHSALFSAPPSVLHLHPLSLVSLPPFFFRQAV